VIPRLGSAWRRTARIAFERPRALIWSTLALTCALLAVGIAGLGALSVDQWSDRRPAASAALVVYLGEGVTDLRATALVGELRRLRGVERVELVAAAESAKRLVSSLGSGAALLEGVDIEALPASIEVTLSPGVRDVVAMSPIVGELRGSPGVSDLVIADAPDDSRRAAGMLGTLRGIAWVAGALFAGLALLTALGSIRVRLDRAASPSGRRELEVIELLGGGSSFLGVPIALAGALQGMFAAILAGGLVLLGLHVYGDSITSSLAGALGPVELATPTLAMLGIFVGAGATLGLVGGVLAAAARTLALPASWRDTEGGPRCGVLA
jgi:cell division protein FtsX